MTKVIHKLLAVFIFALALPALAIVPSATCTTSAIITALPQTIPIPFVFNLTTDLKIMDGTTALTLASDYTVTGGGGSSGSIVVVSGGFGNVQINDTIKVARNMPLTQLTSFSSTGDLTAKMIEQGLDKLTEAVQQVQSVGGGGGGSGGGTVTSVGTGTGLTGGPITTNGTISLGTVPLANVAAMPTNALLGNNTGSPASPSALSAAAVVTMLGITPGPAAPTTYRATGQVGTNTSGHTVTIGTYTVGASDASFEVSCNANLTAFTSGDINCMCAYHDENNASESMKLNTIFQATVGNVGLYAGFPSHIRCKAGTTIVFATVENGNLTANFNVEFTVRPQ